MSVDLREIPFIFSKELLNRNRVLTMSNNRKCNYLIVDVYTTLGNNEDVTTMMAINTQGNKKDILIIKTFVGRRFSELVDEAYWLCNEFYIQTILVDKSCMGIGFIEQFEANINPKNVSIKALDGSKIYLNIDIPEIQNDLRYGNLRFLQAPELAMTSYVKPFLGLSNIMESHKETDMLIDEICNISYKINSSGRISFTRIDESIGVSRLNCLLTFYSYPMSGMVDEVSKNIEIDIKEKYYVTKRIAQYEVIHGVFYKYMFKCVENDGIKVLFCHNGKHKIKQFQNITQEEDFRNLFSKDIEKIKISRDDFEIRFFNGSQIKFVSGGDSSRGSKCHYAVVDSELSRDIYNNVILPACMLFSRDKEDKCLKDNYFIETVDMWMD